MRWLRLQLMVIATTSCFSFSTNEKQNQKQSLIARNSDWLIAQFAAVVIGRSNYFCIGFSTVINKVL